jgi:mRNA interferase MazF
MSRQLLQCGAIITAAFPEQMPQGREQQGYRPAIVVGFPDTVAVPRFPLVMVIPLTSDRGQSWAIKSPSLYPRFPVGVAGLRSPSIALIDQVRALDISRIVAYRGTLSPQEYQPILNGLQQIFGGTRIF